MPVPITLKSPLPSTDLLFESMTASAGLSTIGEMELGLVSEKPDLKVEDLLGKPVTVSVALADESRRHFHGYVTRFGIGAPRGRWFGYRASVRPWLWFLTRTADCRIFQDLAVPDIVKKVFEDHAHADFEFRLFRSYRKWVYCVQYRETDYDFVARLLEHEGIYWYLEHGDGSAKVVLVDSQSAHDAAPGCESLPYYAQAPDSAPDTECVSAWDFATGVEPDAVALASYDFERPAASLKAVSTQPPGDGLPAYEVFDFQGDYLQVADGSQWAEDRLDQHRSDHRGARAATNAHGIEVGRLLALERHPRADQNTRYLVTSIAVAAQVDAYQSDGSPGTWRCDFAAIPSTQQFRPPRRTRKPCVQGPQTALVVGPAGEEIFTDKYGRVKVQFHWDRLGRKNEKSSCWVRVSQPWAGKNFGAVHIPRIGQEVVVDFLEGDPDQPLITGRVYNAEQMPPWELPANATQSGILSRSSKGGSASHANALRFEDKKGAEQLWLHAEKNQDIEVENDESHWVGHDRCKTVDHDETTHVKHDRTETVDNDESITVHGMRTETVDRDETISVHMNRTERVDLDETISIGANRTIAVGASESASVALQRTHSVGINETIAIGAAQEVAIGAFQSVTVGAAQTVSVGGLQSLSVGATRSVSVGASQTTSIGAGQTLSVAANQAQSIGGDRAVKVAGKQAHDIGGDAAMQVGGGRSASVGKDDAFSVGKKFILDAGDEISLTTGSASIVLKKDGSVTIKGKDILLEASGKVSVKASGDVLVKGSKIDLN